MVVSVKTAPYLQRVMSPQLPKWSSVNYCQWCHPCRTFPAVDVAVQSLLQVSMKCTQSGIRLSIS